MKDIGMKELSYNREQIKSGIVHFGVGGFHRSPQAFILARIIQQMR